MNLNRIVMVVVRLMVLNYCRLVCQIVHHSNRCCHDPLILAIHDHRLAEVTVIPTI